MKTSLFLAATTFAIPAFAEIAESCYHDNALRCLISSSAVASLFCSSYASVPVPVQTISTVTPIATITLTTTLTSTETDESFTTTTTITTTTIAAAKRAASAFRRGLPSPTPKCLTAATSYPASRIHSACSCISVTAPTSVIITTVIAPTSTTTVYIRTTTSTTKTATTVESDTATSTCYLQAVQNPGFENNADGSPWSVGCTVPDVSLRVDSTNPHSGQNSYHITGNGLYAYVVSMYQPIVLCPGLTYTFSGWFYATFNFACTISVVATGEVILNTTTFLAVDTWTQYTGTLSSPIAAIDLLITILLYSPPDTDFYVDDVTVTLNP